MRKIWRLQGISESYQIARRFDVPASDRPEVNPQLASLYIDRWLADPFAQQTMVEMYESVSGRAGSGATRLRGLDLHRYIKPELLEAFRRGEFVLLRVPHTTIIPVKEEKKEEEPVENEQPPPPEPPKKEPWIEIEVVDDDEQPLAGEMYRIEFPDGSLHEGRLDANGRIRFNEIDAGTCKVEFPNLKPGKK